jgi:hypothetical protein
MVQDNPTGRALSAQTGGRRRKPDSQPFAHETSRQQRLGVAQSSRYHLRDRYGVPRPHSSASNIPLASSDTSEMRRPFVISPIAGLLNRLDAPLDPPS